MVANPEEIEDAAELDRLLVYLKENRGFDFTGYKRSSLHRRITKRIETVECIGYADYLDFLEVHPDEFAELFDTILINVTAFFRDAPAWAVLADEVLPGVIGGKREKDPIRVWCAGCASGEEAYTAAIVLAEVLGAETFEERVKIYGTDVDEAALATARQGSYEAKALAEVPAELVERYFDTNKSRKVFRPDLRRSVVFGRNDLVQDAPISRIDLLVCRNTLMYFTAETQSNILRRFHFALRADGALFLGKSEMLVTRGSLFTPTDLKHRIFGRSPHAVSSRQRLEFTAAPGGAVDGAAGNGGDTAEESSVRAFDAGPVATIVMDDEGTLAAVNAQARALFGLSGTDIGRPLQDLEVSYRPAELRTSIGRAHDEQRTISAGVVDWPSADGETRKLDIAVSPLLAGTSTLGTSITFSDVTRHVRIEQDLARSRQDLETAYEELQSTVEELETTNEELQSTNEELETTNEELQSTNEELETMNEELQSTNEELETINDELRDRTSELNRVNDFLEAILTSLGVGVAVIDREQRVQVWNDRAEDLWGVRAGEAVDHHLLALDIGLPVESLAAPLRAVMAGTSDRGQVEVEAVNRRGRAITCTTTILPLPASGDAARSGAIILMEDGTGRDGAG